jgi:hypothetical protein
MTMELSRRSLFRGLLAVSALRFLPAVPLAVPAEPLVAPPLNPFAAGSSEALTEMVLALMEDAHKVETIGVIRSVPSFRFDMLDDIGPNESLSEAMTRHLGDGEWSGWDYSVDEVRDAISSLEREDEIRCQAAIRRFYDVKQVLASTNEFADAAEMEVGRSVLAA